MKKNLCIIFGMLISFGMFGSCGNDDNATIPLVPETGQETRQMPKQEDFIKTVTEIGYIRYDPYDNTWIIDVPTPVPPGEVLIDGGTFYYLYDLPEEYQKKGLKVKATLDVYIFHHFDEKEVIIKYAGWEYYDAVLKQIEIAE